MNYLKLSPIFQNFKSFKIKIKNIEPCSRGSWDLCHAQINIIKIKHNIYNPM